MLVQGGKHWALARKGARFGSRTIDMHVAPFFIDESGIMIGVTRDHQAQPRFDTSTPEARPITLHTLYHAKLR